MVHKLILLAAVAVSSGAAQNLIFKLAEPSGEQPVARFDGAIAYDSVGRRVYLFGGNGNSVRNDLWFYSPGENRWTEVAASGPKPPERLGHTLTYDAARRRLILFGGQSRGFFSDVWAFDIAAGTWRALAADEAGPSRRYGHSAVYDSAGDRLVISHGFTTNGRFDDTWAFDLARNSWSNLSPPSGRPLRRCLHDAVFDPATRQMFLFGGCASGNGPCPLDDLWAFDFATNRWTERTGQPRPAAREHYGMVFDTIRSRLVLFGGGGRDTLNDLWEYAPRAGTWQQAQVDGGRPSPRQRHEAAYAPETGTIFFFGGITSGGVTNELWRLDAAQMGPRILEGGVVDAFSGLPGAIAPGQLVSFYGRGLGPAAAATSSADSNGLLPSSVGGVSVTMNGISAPLLFVRADQINAQVPYELQGAREATLVVTVDGASSPAVTVPVAATRPGLFPRAFHPDGSLNSPANPAARGSVVVVYATGQGVTSPPSRTGVTARDVFPAPAAAALLRIGGREAEILFIGQAPATAGVTQINARVPVELDPADTHPVLLTIGGVDSQPGIALSVR
ncbi:MAG: kelch repeat-containing protein [Bryobacteraceae bacterium]